MRASTIFLATTLFLISCTSNTEKKMTNNENPFFVEFDTPYEVPNFDIIKSEHFLVAFKEGISQQMTEIDAITENPEAPTFANTIEAKDASGALLTNVGSVFFNLNSAVTTPEIQKIAKEVAPLLAEHRDNISLNAKLFERVKTIFEQKDNLGLNTEQMFLLEKTYKNFVRGGANVKDEDKDRFREINKQLSLLSVQFGENLLAETNAFQLVIDNKEDLDGLPKFVIDMGADDAEKAGFEGKWLFTVNKPSLIPFIQYSEKRELREKLFKGYINRGDNENEYDNKSIASKLAALRVERSNLLGFPTHAHYILDNNMAKTPENVYALMDQVWKAALPIAKEEAIQLQTMLDVDIPGQILQPWDWWFYSEKLRKEKYDLDEEQLKPYFELSSVQQGMFEVANKLFGLSFTERVDMPKPHVDAHCYEVLDTDGTHQAILYMDFFPRESKRAGAWMSSYRKQYKEDGKNVSPVITMVMNFSKPTTDAPSLLTFEEVKTMYHEFGHALHGMLSDCSYETLSGTSVTRDFVELPSQIMENWAAEPEIMKSYAKHYQTGETIPDELIEKLEASSHFNQGFTTVEFTAAAYLDMNWHTLTEATEHDVHDFEKAAMDKIGLIPEIVVRYRSPYFSHIFAGGYSSGYYGYQWAEVLDADAFEAFKENGIFDQTTALAFRTNILEKGGTDDPMKLYEQFRGKKPTANAMLKRKGLL